MNSPIELRQKLIDSVDEKYHVKDMGAIVDVLSTLEHLAVTKEVLESTRLGKTVNEFRRKVNNDYLAKRAKNLVKRWRDLVLEQDGQATRPHNGSGSGPTSFNASLLLVGPNPSSLSSKVSPSSSLLSSKVSPSSSLVSSKVSPCGSPQNSNSSCSFPISNNNPGGSNGSTSLTNVALRNVQQTYGPTSSPTSISTSLHVGSSAPNKKSPFIGFRNNSNTSPLPQSTSYAPNVEATSKTNSANKRYREESDITIVLNECESPKAKKARKLVNGSGTLDDPLLAFDEISKDSVNSRLSDLSDGSSKLLSHSVSSLPYSSSTAAMLTHQESANFSPPLAASSISSLGEPLSVTSLDNHPLSPSASNINSKPVSPDKHRKKRKKRDEADGIFDTELRAKILKAKAERKDLFQKDGADDKFSSLEPNLELRRIQSAALSPISVKNEIVESYLNSQNQLKAQMQRHAESIEPSIATHDATDSFGKEKNKLLKGKVKSSKSKNKKKATTETNLTATAAEVENRFETEAEILGRLPPIDPAILADFKDYVFYNEPGDDHNINQNENETDTIVHVTKETNKIDWGDSDDEQEPIAAKLSETNKSVQQVNTENVREDPVTRSGIFTDLGNNGNLEVPLREVDDSEVDRLHLDHISSVNGNEDKDGNFREWHEILTVDSFKEDVLHILPYTVIDF